MSIVQIALFAAIIVIMAFTPFYLALSLLHSQSDHYTHSGDYRFDSLWTGAGGGIAGFVLG